MFTSISNQMLRKFSGLNPTTTKAKKYRQQQQTPKAIEIEIVKENRKYMSQYQRVTCERIVLRVLIPSDKNNSTKYVKKKSSPGALLFLSFFPS
jgi:hypothetical protein